jgi:hypothetical protein
LVVRNEAKEGYACHIECELRQATVVVFIPKRGA